MKLIATFLLLALSSAVLAEKSRHHTPSTLPPVLIRYRIADHTSRSPSSPRLAHHTEFWGFDNQEKPLRFRQADTDNSTADSDAEKTLLEDDDITLKGLGKLADADSESKDAPASVQPPTSGGNKDQDPTENEAESNFKIFPYLLIGKTETGDHFPFLAMLRDRKKDAKDPQDAFVPAFVAVAPEPTPEKEEELEPPQQLIAAPILNLPMPLGHLVRHANPLVPHDQFDHRPHPSRPEPAFFQRGFVEPAPFHRPGMPVFHP